MTTRGIRRKKSTLTELKIAVVGAPSVGKSALVVRFLTKRYIGEYDHQAGNYKNINVNLSPSIFPSIETFSIHNNHMLAFSYLNEWNSFRFTENRYKHEAMVDGEPVLFEILDTCPKDEKELSNVTELLNWADGLLLVYSITDRHSFNFIRRARSDLQTDTPVQLVANKVDMVHLRQVSRDEGDILAKDFECKFCEVSAADHVDQVAEAFQELGREVLASKRKSKQSLLERMLGSTRPYSRGKSDSNLPKD